jgi:hypothetical protein
MKIYLDKYTSISDRINFYELEKLLSFDDIKAWDKFDMLFAYMKNVSCWKGCDKEEKVDGVPSMKSWEILTEKSVAAFENVQAFLDINNIEYSIGYPD